MGQVFFRPLIDIGIVLSADHNTARLLKRILPEAKEMGSGGDGTLYTRRKEDMFQFAVMRTDSLDISLGVKINEAINLPEVAMSVDDGHANDKNVASYSTIGSETINVVDANNCEKFAFSGAKGFDESTGCR